MKTTLTLLSCTLILLLQDCALSSHPVTNARRNLKNLKELVARHPQIEVRLGHQH